MKRIFTFGEIMLRVSPSDRSERLAQARQFRIEPGGSESNVAVALAQLGHKVSFLTKIPEGQFRELIFRYLREYGVDHSYISIGGRRLGIYWTENGIGPRASRVIYDREDSSFFGFDISDFDWKKINKEIFWFHASGITPAISEKACRNLFLILDKMDKGVKISIDINYRRKLWRWIREGRREKIRQALNRLCRRAYLVTANESDLQDAFGFSGRICDIESYKKIAKDLFNDMKNLKFLAITLRESFSASRNDWSGVLFVKDGKSLKQFVGPRYKLTDVIDRVGTGDSFSAGIIHGILSFNGDYQHIIDFATALSALNHTVWGDASQFEQRDVEEALLFRGTGRIIR